VRWLPLVFFIAFFLLALVGRSWLAWRASGRNPIVWPNDDSLEGYVARGLNVATFVLLVALALHGGGLTPRIGLLPWAGSVPLFWTGAALFLLALVWVLVAQLQMGAAWRVGIDHAQATDLVESGLFAWSRNPIFFGMRVALAAALLMVPNALVALAALAIELLMQVQARLEEAHLLQLHGDAYRRYCARVRRWIGRRRRAAKS
jgi:protein-S-isoprenylcysteine O-methyltransferase Ste14